MVAKNIQSTLKGIRKGAGSPGMTGNLADQIQAQQRQQKMDQFKMQTTLQKLMQKRQKAQLDARKSAHKQTQAQQEALNKRMFGVSSRLATIAQENPEQARQALKQAPKLAQTLGVDPDSPSLAQDLMGKVNEFRARTGKDVQFEKPKEPEKWRPVTQAEREAYNIPANEAAQINEKTGKIETEGGQTINVGGDKPTPFEEGAQENRLERINTAQKAARDSTNRIGRVQQMRTAIEQGDAQTGFAGETRQVMSQALEMFNLDPEKVAPGLLSPSAGTEVIDAASNQLAVELLGAQEGRTSRLELKTVKRALPELTKTQEGNKIILDVLENKAMRDQQLGAIASVFEGTPDGTLQRDTKVPYVGEMEKGTTFSEAQAAYDKENPIFTEDIREKIENAGKGPFQLPVDNEGYVDFNQMREGDVYKHNNKEYIYRGLRENAEKPYTEEDYILEEK